jgi:hypothetical protein
MVTTNTLANALKVIPGTIAKPASFGITLIIWTARISWTSLLGKELLTSIPKYHYRNIAPGEKIAVVICGTEHMAGYAKPRSTREVNGAT